MKNVRFDGNNDPEGNSQIEVYDYDMNPIKAINLTFLPRKILLDAHRNRLLLLSATDDDIHIINL